MRDHIAAALTRLVIIYSAARSRIVFSVAAPFNPAAATCPPSAIRLRCASSQ